MYNYLIIYSYMRGTGRTFSTRDTRITTIDDILLLENKIKETNVLIMTFQLLES